MNRLKLWYGEMRGRFSEIETAFQIALFGNFWSNHAPSAWHAELHLVSMDSDLADRDTLRVSAKILTAGYELALHGHRLGIDFGITSMRRLESIHRQTIQIELGETEQVKMTDEASVYSFPYQVDLVSKDGRSTILHYKIASEFELEKGQSIAQRANEDFRKRIQLIKKQNLVYFKPVTLQKLFAPISSLTNRVL